MKRNVYLIVSIVFVLTTACAYLMPSSSPTAVAEPPTMSVAPANTLPPAPTEAQAPTNAPEPTAATPTDTATPLAPATTPTMMLLPQTWIGTYSQSGVGKIGITLLIEKMDGASFTGKMIWSGTSSFRGAITKVSGEFVRDFGDATEQAKWGNHPDYKNGDRAGTWIKWTENGFFKGGGYTLGGWYYGHIRDDKSMLGIYYLNLDISSFASSDIWTLKLQK